jgi:hypothetical protein
MKPRQPPRVPLVLLVHCVADNEPLIGDLLEDWRTRSNGWFWRQALLAVLSQCAFQIRQKPRLTTERVLVTTAMLALLGFYTVVIATLMNRIIVLTDIWFPQTGRYQEFQLYFTVPAFAGAVLIGRVLGRLHQRHRVMCILGCGATATIAACLNVYLFVPNALVQPLPSHPATQIALGVIRIAGLLAGVDSRSLCELQPSS